MPGWLYDAGPYGLVIFLLSTVLLGGLAALVAGRALAQTWRPFVQVAVYMLALACVVRFIHYAIFGEVLLSMRNYIIDFIVLFIFSAVGYKLTRRGQMITQYGWMKEGAGP
jgi:hypothetical protein